MAAWGDESVETTRFPCGCSFTTRGLKAPEGDGYDITLCPKHQGADGTLRPWALYHYVQAENPAH